MVVAASTARSRRTGDWLLYTSKNDLDYYGLVCLHFFESNGFVKRVWNCGEFVATSDSLEEARREMERTATADKIAKNAREAYYDATCEN